MRGRGRVRLQGINTASIEYLQQVCSVCLEGIGCKSAVRLHASGVNSICSMSTVICSKSLLQESARSLQGIC